MLRAARRPARGQAAPQRHRRAASTLRLGRHLHRARGHRGGRAPRRVTRIPLLTDARLVVADPEDDDVVLRPPRQRESLEDVGRGGARRARVPTRGRAAREAGAARRHSDDRDRAAVAADPRGQHGGPRTSRSPRSPTSSTASASTQMTILVAGGLSRRTTPREIGLLVPPEFRRRFNGRVLVHDAEADDLVDLGARRQRRLARQPGARRDRPRRHRHRRRDRPPRRPGRPARGERPRVAARRGRSLAARDERVAGLEARRRDRAAPRRAGRRSPASRSP